MSQKDIERYIRERKRNARSVDEQVAISHAMWNQGIDPSHDGYKAKEIKDELGLDLDYSAKTSLKHLEEINIVEEFAPPGPEILAIAEWMDDGKGEIVLGRVGEAAEEGLDALASEIESPPSGSRTAAAADGSGVTIRSVVASEFDLVPDKVEDYLRSTDNPVDVLNGAVEAIKDADGIGVSDDYGKIAFIRMPYRYRLTEKVTDLYNR